MGRSGLRALRGIRVGIGLAVLSTALASPVGAQGQKPSGAEVWAANCSRCHRLRAIDAYSAVQWETIVTQMGLYARMTPDEIDAVREFLVGSARAREPAADRTAEGQREVLTLARVAHVMALPSTAGCSTPAGEAVYAAQCRVCHGAKGKGDGPAAGSLNPRPSNLAQRGALADWSDDSLRQVIAGGQRTMPAFGKILDADDLREVIAFLRCLSEPR